MLIPILLLTLIITPSAALAQGMMGNWTSSSPSATYDDHTAREEQEGKETWEKLQSKQIECKNLTDEQYGSLGEYFMGQSIGDTQRHVLMNQMMTNMMGEEGEEQAHIAMGKRLSGCEPNAQVPSNGVGFMPMMGGFGLLGWIPMLLFWILLILGVIALFRYLDRSGQQQDSKTPLDILKERYARGDIDKKEFEEKKKDII